MNEFETYLSQVRILDAEGIYRPPNKYERAIARFYFNMQKEAREKGHSKISFLKLRKGTSFISHN